MQYLLHNERKYLCDRATEQSLEPPTRRILVQWMIRVHERFELSCGTIFLAVNVFDRVLKGNSFRRREMQVLAAASLFVASKYEEVECPRLEAFVRVGGGAYTREELVDA